MVSTGNGSNFYSGVVDLNNPASRDILLTQAPIVGSLPEPGSLATISLALGFLTLVRRRGR